MTFDRGFRRLTRLFLEGKRFLPWSEPTSPTHPSQRKPRFPQRLPEAARRRGRLCLPPFPTDSPRVWMPVTIHLRRFLALLPAYGSTLRPRLRPAAPLRDVANASRSTLRTTLYPATRRASKELSRRLRAYKPPEASWPLLSLLGENRGGFAPANPMGSSSLDHSPALSRRAAWVGGGKGLSGARRLPPTCAKAAHSRKCR